MQGRLRTKGQSLGGGFWYQHTLSKSQTINVTQLRAIVFFLFSRPLATYAIAWYMRNLFHVTSFIYDMRVNYSKSQQMFFPFSLSFLGMFVVVVVFMPVFLTATPIITQVRRGREPHRLLPAVARRAPHRLQAGLHVRNKE